MRVLRTGSIGAAMVAELQAVHFMIINYDIGKLTSKGVPSP
jgi:hypothetical protein